VTTYPILYTGINKALRFLGLGPQRSGVDVTEDSVRVRLGWAFHLEAPRSQVASAALDTRPVLGWGAHGWGHVWLVNGSSKQLVRIDFTDLVHARTMVFAIRVRTLRVSVEDPDGLVRALGGVPA